MPSTSEARSRACPAPTLADSARSIRSHAHWPCKVLQTARRQQIKVCPPSAAQGCRVCSRAVCHARPAHRSILYQRSIYPEQSFDRTNKYGCELWLTTDKGLSTYLESIEKQMKGEHAARGSAPRRRAAPIRSRTTLPIFSRPAQQCWASARGPPVAQWQSQAQR